MGKIISGIVEILLTWIVAWLAVTYIPLFLILNPIMWILTPVIWILAIVITIGVVIRMLKP